MRQDSGRAVRLQGAWAREGGLRLAGRGLAGRGLLRERLLELVGVPCRGWEAAPSLPAPDRHRDSLGVPKIGNMFINFRVWKKGGDWHKCT